MINAQPESHHSATTVGSEEQCAMTTLRVEPLTMPGVELGAENPLPRFRERNPHRHVRMPDL